MPGLTRRSETLDPYDVADRLHSAAIHLLRRVAREDPKSGLSAARLSALSVVVFGGPLTIGELAAFERVQPPTMTKIVQGLEQEGLVERRAGTRDRRSVTVHATQKGRRLLKAARTRRVRNLADALRLLDRRELELLARAAAIVEEGVVGRGREV